MKSILSLLCLVALTFGMMSCSKDQIKETLSDQVSKTVSKVIVAELECDKANVVQSDIKVMTDKLFKIEAEKESTVKIASAVSSNQLAAIDAKVIICRSITGALMPTVVNLMKQGKLAKWECKVTKGEAVLTDLIYKGCDKLSAYTPNKPGTKVAMNLSYRYNSIDRPPRIFLA